MAQEMFEVEIKIRLPAAAVHSFVGKCRSAAGSDGIEQSQLDEYFDGSGGELRRADLTLRLRTLNGTVYVAMKGPRVRSEDGVYRRIELEFVAGSEVEVREQISRQGLFPAAVVEKRRRGFRIGDAWVFIDQVPFLGAFVEVEARDNKTILATLNQLGITRVEPVSENYTELLEARFVAEGLPTRPSLRATFREQARWRRREGRPGNVRAPRSDSNVRGTPESGQEKRIGRRPERKN